MCDHRSLGLSIMCCHMVISCLLCYSLHITSSSLLGSLDHKTIKPRSILFDTIDFGEYLLFNLTIIKMHVGSLNYALFKCKFSFFGCALSRCMFWPLGYALLRYTFDLLAMHHQCVCLALRLWIIKIYIKLFGYTSLRCTFGHLIV